MTTTHFTNQIPRSFCNNTDSITAAATGSKGDSSRFSVQIVIKNNGVHSNQTTEGVPACPKGFRCGKLDVGCISIVMFGLYTTFRQAASPRCRIMRACAMRTTRACGLVCVRDAASCARAQCARARVSAALKNAEAASCARAQCARATQRDAKPRTAPYGAAAR